MKRIIVFLSLIAASTHLKAQSLKTPDLKLNDGLQNAFKPVTPLTPQQMLIQPSAANNETLFYSTMPVVKPSSVDHMAILKPDKNVINPAEQPATQTLP